jgi:hypothetical protein
MARDLALERSWRERLRRYERSGLTIREFCKQEDLSAAQFSWWRAELRRRVAKAAPGRKGGKKTTKRSRARKNAKRSKAVAAGFFPVEVKHSLPALASVEVVLDRPPRIRISRGFDPKLLRDVVRVLEQK